VFTATVRTKASTPVFNAIATDGTRWVLTGAVGGASIQYTTDGITYNAGTGAGIGGASSFSALLYDGTNFVAINTGGGAGGVSFSSNGGITWGLTGSTIGFPSAGLQTAMTRSPTLGTVGRICIVSGAGAATGAYTSDDRWVTWTVRNTTLAGLFHVCWTGNRFIATCNSANTIVTSTDGITWTAQTPPMSTSAVAAAQGSIISDGAGKVLWLDALGTSIFTSVDHGVTWASRGFGYSSGAVGTNGGLAQHFNSAVANFTNGRFFICVSGTNTISQNQIYSSVDLASWALVETPQVLTNYTQFSISFKAGVYFMSALNTSTQAYTMTEDLTLMRLPQGHQGQNGYGTTGGGSYAGSWNNFMPFIKVQ
jgi:hypothetical protein